MFIFTMLIFLTIQSCRCFDLLSLTIGGIGSGLGLYNIEVIKQYSYCKLPNVECCPLPVTDEDLHKLQDDLSVNVYGQHIIATHLVPALKAHLLGARKSKKPLVISFQGTPGTGKNFVAEYIAKHLYKNGIKSNFVHIYGKADFPSEKLVDVYKVEITQRISNAIYKCPRSLFIFDEIDKIPRGVFESITTFLDYHDNIKGVDYSQAIFIFISNTAGKEIGDQLYKLMRKGLQRISTKLHDFETILEAGAYSMAGGLQGGSILEAHLIDHFFPFLPMEKQHVKDCIKAEYKRWDIIPSEISINEILENYVTYDQDYNLYSVAGCKRLDSKVKMNIKMNY